MKTGFRTKVFLAAIAAACVAVLVVALLLSWQVRERQRTAIERRLMDEAAAIAALLPAASTTAAALDGEADRVGRYVASRVTFVGADGRVVGDSAQPLAALASMENHLARPEVAAAAAGGVGVSARYSTTVTTDLLYVAVRASHPAVRYVRLALPLTEIDAQLAAIRRMTLVALAVAIPVALLVSWAVSAPLGRRVRRIAAVARRYSSGDLSRPAHDYGGDELGEVARALDASIQELGRRLHASSQERARMDAILSGMGEGVLLVDPEGRLLLANPAARRMLRVDEASIGRPYVEVIRHPDIAAQLTAVLQGGDADPSDLVLSRDPGRVFVARTRSVAGGGGAVLVLHDITDLRRADQIRRDFVANVSHELRTPLTAIRGYVEALQDERGHSAGTRRFLEVIGRQSARMERLVADLLRLARLDAGQEPLERTRCDLAQVFAAVVADLQPSIAGKRQHVTTEVSADAGAIEADAAQLQDIVRNLVENAVNYSPAGAHIQLATVRDGDRVTITVADSGVGIPPADLTRVFERFYRVDKARARPGGTGLGLAIVKHLVELHGGEVTAANRPAGGAVFTVTLPTGPLGV